MIVDFLGHCNPNEAVNLVGVSDYTKIFTELGDAFFFFGGELHVAVGRAEGEGRPGVVCLAAGGAGVEIFMHFIWFILS